MWTQNPADHPDDVCIDSLRSIGRGRYPSNGLFTVSGNHGTTWE